MASIAVASPANRRRALVVDDSPIARHVLARLLKGTGLEVDVEESAEAALERLSGDLPDVVFMDHILPGMDGLEAVRNVRARPETRDLPIVMYTAQRSTEFAARAMLAGANDVFVKTGTTNSLDSILMKLGLKREANATVGEGRDDSTAPRSNRAREQLHRGGPRNDASMPAAVANAIRPLLRAEQEKLRQELLAEFAILERYEERMRQDLFARVGTLMHASSDRMDKLFDKHTRQSRNRRGGGTALRPLLAAAAGLIVALGAISVLWRIDRTIQDATEQTRAAFAAVDAQADALARVEQNLTYLASAREARVSSTPMSPRASERLPPAIPPNAASVLVDEIQSMGILGPIRIETDVGAFCVSSRSGRPELEAGSLSLEQCENVSAPLAVASL